MSLYVLMRLLESAPSRYEPGIRLLTLGRLEHVYDRLVIQRNIANQCRNSEVIHETLHERLRISSMPKVISNG